MVAITFSEFGFKLIYISQRSKVYRVQNRGVDTKSHSNQSIVLPLGKLINVILKLYLGKQPARQSLS